MTEEVPEAPPVEPEPEPGAAKGPPPAAPATPDEDWPTRFKYLLADFENFRRRSEREREVARHTARAELLHGLLPLYETFERGLAAARRLDRDDPLRKGLELLDREWATFWKSEGVEPVARIGMAFESDWHEAVGEGPATPANPPGTIVEVVQQGYRGRAGLLRPAKVIVARAPSPVAESPPAEVADLFADDEE